MDHKACKHLAYSRIIVDGEHKIRSYAGKVFSQFLKVTDFKIVSLIWRFIVRRVKKKECAGLVIGLDELLPWQMLGYSGQAQMNLGQLLFDIVDDLIF